MVNGRGMVAVLALALAGGGLRADGPGAAGGPAGAVAPTGAASAGNTDDRPVFPHGVPGKRGAGASGAGANAEPAAGARGWSDVLAMGGPLALVVGLIVVCAGVLRRAAGATGPTLAAALGPGGHAPSGLLDVIGRYPIARGQTLVLLRMERRVLLLGHTLPTRSSPGGFATLAEVTDADEIASMLIKSRDARGESAANQFAEVIARMEQGELGEREALEQRRVIVTPAGDAATLWRDDPTAIPPFARSTPAAAVGGGPVGGGGDSQAIKARLAALRGRAAMARPAGGAA